MRRRKDFDLAIKLQYTASHHISNVKSLPHVFQFDLKENHKRDFLRRKISTSLEMTKITNAIDLGSNDFKIGILFLQSTCFENYVLYLFIDVEHFLGT